MRGHVGSVANCRYLWEEDGEGSEGGWIMYTIGGMVNDLENREERGVQREDVDVDVVFV